MAKYQPAELEPKWQKAWSESKIFSPDLDRAKKPFYNLMMFPYPTAEGMHVGNMYAFTGADVYGRFMRMKGYDVFEPIGLDGFGIHSENYAIKVGRHPKEQAKISEKNFYRQLHEIGNSFDWTRTVETYDPSYYKWTQWIFIKLFRAGLAYKKKAPVNWCPLDKTVLADEQVIDGKCERDGAVVEKREFEQWFFRITKYAQRLLDNIDKLDWSEKVKIAQRNWIGKKEGINITYEIQGSKEKVVCFTTRPDTNFGATFIVIGPEHGLVEKLLAGQISFPRRRLGKLKGYVGGAKKKTEQERIEEGKKKTGVFTGLYAINNLNGKRLPIWVSDFVLGHVGTGAVVGVPGHDLRDFEFAKTFDLPIIRVVVGKDGDRTAITRPEQVQEEDGTMINSDFLDGMDIHKATTKIMDYLERNGWGKRIATYHLRDWLISRQRYWGPPIPMIYCQKCNWQPVPEADLPVLLPEVSDWKPKGTGKSPLASVESFVNTKCPNCKGPAKRETDVSDTFLDSAWYFFRYTSTDDTTCPWKPERVRKWLPVNMYIGGAEHAVLHLLYARFLTMAFGDLKLISHFEEPFIRFYAHGLLIKDGAKMSKSRGNVVVPDSYIKRYGADCLRMYLMFLGPFAAGGDFSDSSVEGISRFLNKVWRLAYEGKISGEKNGKYDFIVNRTIKRVTEDIEKLSFNTAIAALMEYYNELTGPRLGKLKPVKLGEHFGKREVEVFLKLLAPFAPHMTEEIWQEGLARGAWGVESLTKTKNHNLRATSIHNQPWPKYDEKLAKPTLVTIVVQINGKVRDRLPVEAGTERSEVEKLALTSAKVIKFLGNSKPQNVFFVPDRLINIVV